MSGSKKLNNKSNVIFENFKRFRQESGYSQSKLCEKLELMGLQLYKVVYFLLHLIMMHILYQKFLILN